MALVFNSTPGTAGFNAYASIAEVTDYETSKGGTTFAAKTTAQKEALIIWASRTLDGMQWKGYMTDPLQPMQWPRTGVWIDGQMHDDYYGDNLIYSSYQFSTTAIPQFIKDTVSELTLQLNTSDVTAATGTEGFKRIKVDSIELEVVASDRAGWFSDAMRNLCWRYLRNSSRHNAPTNRVG
jgi:hypothetical protein